MTSFHRGQRGKGKCPLREETPGTHDLSQVTRVDTSGGKSWRQHGPLTRCDQTGPSLRGLPPRNPPPRPRQETHTRHVSVQRSSLKSQTSHLLNGQVHQNKESLRNRPGPEEVQETGSDWTSSGVLGGVQEQREGMRGKPVSSGHGLNQSRSAGTLPLDKRPAAMRMLTVGSRGRRADTLGPVTATFPENQNYSAM